MSKIQQLVDRGLVLRREIKDRQEELKAIEESLESAGLKAEQTELKDQDREGRRWLARGTDVIVPVIFTADKLVASFQEGTKVHKQIVAALPDGVKIEKFFTRCVTFKSLFEDGKVFRANAEALLDKQAPKFITACVAKDKHGIPKSDVKIAWDRAEPINPPAS